MAKQKKPDQSPEVFRAYYERLGIKVDSDKIMQFVNDSLSSPYRTPSQEDSQSAAVFLLELVQAAHYGKDWEPYKKRLGVKKLRDDKKIYGFDPDLATLDSLEFTLVMQWLRKEIKKIQAINKLVELYECDEKTAGRWIDKIKPRAEQQLIMLDRLMKKYDR